MISGHETGKNFGFHVVPSCTPVQHTSRMSDPHKLLFSRREAADLLSISLRSLDELVSTNKIEVSRIGKRVLVTRRALLWFVQRISAADVPSIEHGRDSMMEGGQRLP